jgi:cell wall-associated NlpC family hydrolase
VNPRALGPVVIGLAVMGLLALLVIPMAIVGGTSLLFSSGGSSGTCSTGSTATQPKASSEAADSIPANYLMWFQKVGKQYNVPWTILAGIGEVESDDGRTTLTGVMSNSNSFGAAGPMQIGISGASGDTWGGAAIHPASQVTSGVATDEDGDGKDDVYDPADAIAGAAKYLIEHNVQTNAESAIFAYNHADWYVEEVLSWASKYASGGFTVAGATAGSGNPVTTVASETCSDNGGQLDSFVSPNAIVTEAITYAEEQIGKPYLFGGDGPAAYDCSGLTMMAYRAAGVNIERTSELQYASLPAVSKSDYEVGDLVFFAGSDGTLTDPGHVGLVIGKNKMIEAYATGTNIRVSTFGLPTSPGGDNVIVGFAQPWPDSNT